MVRSVRQAGGQKDIDLLRTVFIDEAAHYFGASGNTSLNDAGDREHGNYDFWGVRSSGNGFVWYRTAWFDSATGTLTRL